MPTLKNFAGLLAAGAVGLACLIPTSVNADTNEATAAHFFTLDGPGAEACSSGGIIENKAANFICDIRKLNDKEKKKIHLTVPNGDYKVVLENLSPGDPSRKFLMLFADANIVGRMKFGGDAFLTPLESKTYAPQIDLRIPWEVNINPGDDAVFGLAIKRSW